MAESRIKKKTLAALWELTKTCWKIYPSYGRKNFMKKSMTYPALSRTWESEQEL